MMNMKGGEERKQRRLEWRKFMDYGERNGSDKNMNNV
jgi:hypothetical protein